MSIFTARNRSNLIVLCLVTLGLAACGGAESRKARHIEKGDSYFAAGNYDKARIEFRNALQIKPSDAEARYKNGIVDEKLGNPREAAGFYQAAIESNPDNLAARTALGRIYALNGAPDRALEAIKPGLEKHPDDAELLTVRAAARSQLKDAAGAFEDAQRAVSLAPSNEDAVAVLAGIYKAQDHPDKALELLEGATTRLPDNVSLRLTLAQLYASMGQDARVEGLLTDIVRLKPEEPGNRLRLAQFYARLNHVDEAEHVLRDAVRLIPKDQSLKAALIDFLASRRSRDAAARELTAMISAAPDNTDLKFLQAQFDAQGKDYPKAQSEYEALIADEKLNSAGITARNRLAALRLQLGDRTGAEKLLAEVLENNPRDSEALVMRGNIALEQKDPKTAIADLRAVLRDQPNAVGVMRSLARAHLANDEPALAEETMRRAVDANPRDTSARLDLAQLLLQTGKAEQAKPIVEELVRQAPDNMTALETEFRVDAAVGDKSSALAAANAMVATHPQDPLGFYDQGAVAESDRHYDEALRLFSQALSMKSEATEPLEGVVRVLVSTNRVPEALKRLDEAAAQNPKVPAALSLKGQVLLSVKRPAEAQAAYAAALERESRWWVPYRGLAASQFAQHQDAAAVATLQAGIAKATEPDALQADLAQYYERQGKSADAIALYEKILQHNPLQDAAANNLAMLLITYRHDDASLDRAKALVARFAESSNPNLLDTYGWVLFKRGDDSGALPKLQSAAAKTPDSPVIAYHLGMALAQAGQSAAARDSLSRSLKSGENFPGVEEAKSTLDKLVSQAAASRQPPAT